MSARTIKKQHVTRRIVIESIFPVLRGKYIENPPPSKIFLIFYQFFAKKHCFSNKLRTFALSYGRVPDVISISRFPACNREIKPMLYECN